MNRLRTFLRTRPGTLATIVLALMPMILMFDLSAFARPKRARRRGTAASSTS